MMMRFVVFIHTNDTKHRSEVMGSILHYDEKQHMKTVRQEGYEDGYDAARENMQNEMDILTATIADKDAIIADKDSEITRLRAELEKLQK